MSKGLFTGRPTALALAIRRALASSPDALPAMSASASRSSAIAAGMVRPSQ
jgi:hypothetical protein